MNDTQKQNLVTYFALGMVPIFYFILMLTLTLTGTVEGFSSMFYLYLVIMIVVVGISILMVYNAIKNDLERTVVIIRFAFLQIPVITALLFWMLDAFEVLTV